MFPLLPFLLFFISGRFLTISFIFCLRCFLFDFTFDFLLLDGDFFFKVDFVTGTGTAGCSNVDAIVEWSLQSLPLIVTGTSAITHGSNSSIVIPMADIAEGRRKDLEKSFIGISSSFYLGLPAKSLELYIYYKIVMQRRRQPYDTDPALLLFERCGALLLLIPPD